MSAHEEEIKKEKEDIAKVNPELQGLDIRINPFGELVSNVSLDRLNSFLDKNVIDKKLEEKYQKEQAAREKKMKEKAEKKKKKD